MKSQDVPNIPKFVPKELFCYAFRKKVEIVTPGSNLPLCVETCTKEGVCDDRLCIWSMGVAVGLVAGASLSGEDPWSERELAFYSGTFPTIDWCESAWDPTTKFMPVGSLVTNFTRDETKAGRTDTVTKIIQEAVAATASSQKLQFFDLWSSDYPKLHRTPENPEIVSWAQRCVRNEPDILFWMGPSTMIWFLPCVRPQNVQRQSGKRPIIKLDRTDLEEILQMGRGLALQRLRNASVNDEIIARVCLSSCHKLAWCLHNGQPPIIYAGQEYHQKEDLQNTAACDICGSNIREGEGHQLTTPQVVTRSEYWQFPFKGPWSHFVENCKVSGISYIQGIESLSSDKAQDSTAWLVCSSCYGMLGSLDPRSSEYARKFWQSSRQWQRPNATSAIVEVTAAAAIEGFWRVFGHMHKNEDAPTLVYAYGNGYCPSSDLATRMALSWFNELAVGYDEPNVLAGIPIIPIGHVKIHPDELLDWSQRTYAEIMARHPQAYVQMLVIGARYPEIRVAKNASKDWADEIGDGLLMSLVFHGKAAETARGRSKKSAGVTHE